MTYFFAAMYLLLSSSAMTLERNSLHTDTQSVHATLLGISHCFGAAQMQRRDWVDVRVRVPALSCSRIESHVDQYRSENFE
jgi:hypothetical protein